MNRKLGQFDSTSSFDLMLDVLSNVFGGVILISCLLAILPRHSAPPPLWPAEIARSDMLERRIESAKSELESIQRQIDRLSRSGGVAIAELYAERDRLKQTLAQLDKEIADLAEQENADARTKATIALGKEEELADALRKLEARLSSEQNSARAMREKIAFLEKRLKSLGDETNKLGKGQIYAVRFPRERGDAGNPLPIIVRYGRVYPTYTGDPLEKNDAIRWLPVNDDASMANCIPGKGYLLPGDSPALLKTLRRAKQKGLYITVYLYPDSHEVFQELKAQIFAAKIGYGLEFVENGRHLVFSSEGSAPPEL